MHLSDSSFHRRHLNLSKDGDIMHPHDPHWRALVLALALARALAVYWIRSDCRVCWVLVFHCRWHLFVCKCICN